MVTSMIPVPSDSNDDDVPAEISEEMQAAINRLQSEIHEILTAPGIEKSSSVDVPVPQAESADDVGQPIDRRLYLPLLEGWVVRVQTGSSERCFLRNPNEDWFHLLLNGEIYLESGTTKLCLNCAARQGVVTDDRLFWQHCARPPKLLSELTHETPIETDDSAVVDQIVDSTAQTMPLADQRIPE